MGKSTQFRVFDLPVNLIDYRFDRLLGNSQNGKIIRSQKYDLIVIQIGDVLVAKGKKHPLASNTPNS